MLFEKILYFCRKKAASQQSEQAPLHSVCTFLHLKGVFFLRVQIDCIMAFYFCIQIVTVRPLGLENVCFPISFRKVLMK